METSEKIQGIPLTSASWPSATTEAWTPYKERFKRYIDILLFFLICPFVLPVLLLLMILIKVSDWGPAVFKSERIGLGGRKFYCLKLRTMCVNAQEKLNEVLKDDAALREEWEQTQKLKDDPRVTKIGKVIRALSLDELPQIFNVLKGEMSFVGPRPIVESEIAKYAHHFKDYISVRPGITGLWQVSGRNDTTYEERVLLDKAYVSQHCFNLDLKIILKTLPVALSKKGAY